MRLADLIAGERVKVVGDLNAQTQITHVTADSRDVCKGSLFVAIQGSVVDGRKFIADALEKGAVALLTDKPLTVDVPIIISQNPAKSFAHIVSKFYPKKPNFIAGVTGTNGKTSVCVFARQLWALMDEKSANIGTIGTQIQEGEAVRLISDPGLTSLDPGTLHTTLEGLKKASVEHVALEASSHGLDQYRLDGVSFDAAAFTNFTHDHLDYHKSEEAYFQAKMRLFNSLLSDKSTVILNADIPEFSTIKNICEKRGYKIIEYGQKAQHLKILEYTPHKTLTKVKLNLMGKSYTVEFPLLGMFQLYNALCAVGILLASGKSVTDIMPHLLFLKSVPGRLESVEGHPMGCKILVDYAHTPDALENVLLTVRPYVAGNLRLVFGCGGDRDISKREIMGKIAAKCADDIYVTDDNPRTECASEIRKMILTGCPDAMDVAGRAEAIKMAVSALQEGDVLVIAGKGHEDYQIIGKDKIHFDDREVVKDALGTL